MISATSADHTRDAYFDSNFDMDFSLEDLLSLKSSPSLSCRIGLPRPPRMDAQTGSQRPTGSDPGGWFLKFSDPNSQKAGIASFDHF